MTLQAPNSLHADHTGEPAIVTSTMWSICYKKSYHITDCIHGAIKENCQLLLHIPQFPLLHDSTAVVLPTHGVLTEVHVRVFVRVPEPQVTEHAPNSDHADHLPDAVNKSMYKKQQYKKRSRDEKHQMRKGFNCCVYYISIGCCL